MRQCVVPLRMCQMHAVSIYNLKAVYFSLVDECTKQLVTVSYLNPEEHHIKYYVVTKITPNLQLTSHLNPLVATPDRPYYQEKRSMKIAPKAVDK